MVTRRIAKLIVASIAAIALLVLGTVAFDAWVPRQGPSLTLRLQAAIAAWRAPATDDEQAFNEWKAWATSRTYPEPAPMPGALRRCCEIDEQRIAGHRVVTITPRATRTDTAARRRLVYLHGGSWVAPIAHEHWQMLARVARDSGASITVPLYPLAPEFGHRDALAFLDEVQRRLRSEASSSAQDARAPRGPQEPQAAPSAQATRSTQAKSAARTQPGFVLAGDSAGAGLALAHAIRLRDAGAPQPDRIVLLSPWLDASLSNPQVVARASGERFLALRMLREAGRWWARDVDPASPEVSPIHANPSGLPPIEIHQGSADMLEPDALRLQERVKAEAGRVELVAYPGAHHAFFAAGMTPESRRVVQALVSALHEP